MKQYIQTSIIAFLTIITFIGASPKAEETDKDLIWYEYVNDAYAESQKTGKPIMANFTGSDWCGWCIKLHKEVFGTEEFKEWADENVVLLELDFPKRTALPDDLVAQNRGMQQAFGVSGFPTIWFFNLTQKDDGNFDIQAIGKSGYVAGGPATWTGNAEKILEAAE